MGVNTAWRLAHATAHRPAELIQIELRDHARQQRMLGLTLTVFLGITRHIQPNRPGGTQHQIDPLQRLVGGRQRIGQPGQLQGFLFIHRHDGDMFTQEIAPELRIVGDDVFRTQSQHHRNLMLLGVGDGLHGRVTHRLARFATHQVGGQHQRRGASDHRLGNTLRTELIHHPRADGESALAVIADQRKTTADRTIHPLQMIQVGTAGGIAQVTVGVAADLHVLAHHAQQHRTVVSQDGVVMQGIADGAASELMGDQVIGAQLLVQRLRHLILDHQRVSFT